MDESEENRADDCWAIALDVDAFMAGGALLWAEHVTGLILWAQ